MQFTRTGLTPALSSLSLCLAVVALLPCAGQGQPPGAPQVKPDDLLQQSRQRQEIEDQRQTEIVRQVIQEANRRRRSQLVEAHQFLKRTLAQLQEDSDLGEGRRAALAEQLKKALSVVDLEAYLARRVIQALGEAAALQKTGKAAAARDLLHAVLKELAECSDINTQTHERLIRGALASAREPVRVRDTLSARLFPMKVGDRWVYEFGEKEVTFAVLRTEKVGESTVYVVRRTIDRTAVDFKVSVEEDGVYIHQESKKEFLPPLRQFAFFARTGDSWKWRGTVSGKLQKEEFENLGVQEVTVPAGTYSAVAVHQSNPDTTDQATFWLAPGVGVVKLSGESEVLSGDPRGGKVVFEWNLKKFESGKK
jgi:hypothetical protein